MKSVKLFCLGCSLAVAGASPSLMATSLKAPEALKDLELKLVSDLIKQNFNNVCFLAVTSDDVKKMLKRSSDNVSDSNESVKVGSVDFTFDSSKSTKHGVLMLSKTDTKTCNDNLVFSNDNILSKGKGFLMGVDWKKLNYLNPRRETTLVMHNGDWGDKKEFLFCFPFVKEGESPLIKSSNVSKVCSEQISCKDLNDTEKSCKYGVKTDLRFNSVVWLGVSLGN